MNKTEDAAWYVVKNIMANKITLLKLQPSICNWIQKKWSDISP